MDTDTIYKEIGRMAYAVAKSNGVIKETEVENIYLFIDEELKTTGTDAVLCVGSEFTRLRMMNASARDAFDMFTHFMETHGNTIQNRIKYACVRLAIRIAYSDESLDETEVALINKLMKKLQIA